MRRPGRSRFWKRRVQPWNVSLRLSAICPALTWVLTFMALLLTWGVLLPGDAPGVVILDKERAGGGRVARDVKESQRMVARMVWQATDTPATALPGSSQGT